MAFTRVPETDDDDGGSRKGWIAPNAVSSTIDAERFDGRVITSMRYKRDGTRSLRADPSVNGKRQLFVVSAAGGTPRQVTDLPFSVGQVIWHPNGQTVVFSGNEKEDDELNRDLLGQLYAVPVAGGEPVAITTNPGKLWRA